MRALKLRDGCEIRLSPSQSATTLKCQLVNNSRPFTAVGHCRKILWSKRGSKDKDLTECIRDNSIHKTCRVGSPSRFKIQLWVQIHAGAEDLSTKRTFTNSRKRRRGNKCKCKEDIGSTVKPSEAKHCHLGIYQV